MLTTTSGEFMWMLSLLPTNTLRGADTDTSAGTPSSSKKTNPPTHLAVALNLLAVFNTCGGSRSKTKLLHEGESAELHDHTRHTHSIGQTAHTQHRSDRTHSTGQTARCLPLDQCLQLCSGKLVHLRGQGLVRGGRRAGQVGSHLLVKEIMLSQHLTKRPQHFC